MDRGDAEAARGKAGAKRPRGIALQGAGTGVSYISNDFTHVSFEARRMRELLTCPLCKGLLRNAHKLKECIHTFCGDCLAEALARRPRKCPQCDESVTEESIAQDATLQALVDRIFSSKSPVSLEDGSSQTQTKRAKAEPQSSPGERGPEAKVRNQGGPTPNATGALAGVEVGNVNLITFYMKPANGDGGGLGQLEYPLLRTNVQAKVRQLKKHVAERLHASRSKRAWRDVALQCHDSALSDDAMTLAAIAERWKPRDGEKLELLFFLQGGRREPD